MKNRTKNGIVILCLCSSAALLSCKKESTSPVINQTASSGYYEDPVDIVEEPTVIGDVSAIGNLSVDQSANNNPNALTAPYQRLNLIFDYSSEASNSLTTFSNYSSTNWAFNQKCCSYSTQRSTAYVRAGGYSTRYELNKTDGDAGGSKRSETGRYTKSETNPFVERWYAASYFLPADFVADKAAESPTQWHTTSTQYPPLAVWTQSGQWRLVQFGKVVTILGNYSTGKWTDFVYHVKWSAGTDGLVEVWKDGVKILTKTGKNIEPSVTTGAYMRTGIYKWPWKSGTTSTTTKRVLYVDEVRIGNAAATYKDVAPGQ